MSLGNFSTSLAVKDLDKSREFYEALGFTKFAGDPDHGYLIMKSGDCIIGLFQGMFEKNILTFNPGWDSNCNTLEDFKDVREIQKELKARGISFQTEADETTSGPASCTLLDPDGNPILLDQHV
ncbi:MAG: glyoxalase [Hirschia sp.]|nr:glyoxalase [Hirschia sp.]MBF17869.1 glyoxalase [Hirschia sp.]|tara:strand:+ start:236 stop:607 length:372 start_codon:yes stop_codon:yes gene_type:complete